MALIDKKLTELTEILSVPDNAFIHVVDPNDVSQSPQGSSYKAKKSTIGGAVKAQVTVSGTVKVDSNNADPIVYLKSKVDALLAEKQNTLVNTVNIASINGQNLLNGGNIETANTIPTLQNVLDNNHDLVGGNNFQGTGAGLGNTGNNINALGESSAALNTGDQVNALSGFSAYNNLGSDVNALGFSSAALNTGNQVNALGAQSAFRNTGSQVNALGSDSGFENTFNNVNLFGNNTTADEDGQTVFGKTNTIFARLSTLLLTATRKYILPNQSGTIALTSDLDAIPNPTLNFLPKKGASGFVDSAISENATNVLSAKVLRLAAGLTPSNAQDLTTLDFFNNNQNVKLLGTTFFAGSKTNFNNNSSNFFGTAAGNGATNANSSNFFGTAAGNGATNANDSNFFGVFCGSSAVEARSSNFFGTNAGRGATNSSNSNFFGNSAGNVATNAPNSNFFGNSAGNGATNANDSNFFGSEAGRGATSAPNSNFFGNSAGNGATNADSSNLFGINAGRAFTGNNIGSNNIIIGNYISLPNGYTNSMNIGGVLFGRGFNIFSPDPKIVPNNGRIGINVVDPTDSLEVLGSIKLSNLLKLGQFTTATEPAYVKGASFFNTTLNKMRIGGATAYETVTSS